MLNIGVVFSLDSMKEAFSDCIDSGAELTKDDANQFFSLDFPQNSRVEELYLRFRLSEDEKSVNVSSNYFDRSRDLSVEDFLDNIDVLSAKLLSIFDGVDRGV